MKTLLFLGMCIPMIGCACSKVDNTTIKEFDLSKYLGSWYEIARFDHSFERGISYAQAHYSLKDDGTVKVENTGIKDGEYKESVGKAFQPDPENDPALLRVSFFGPFYSDYRVLMITPDYNYAVVGSKGANYLWFLSRTPEVPSEILQAMIDEAQRRGYDTSKLIWVEQDAELTEGVMD